MRLEFLGDEDLALLVPLALADHRRCLAIAQEAVSDLEGGRLGGAKAGGEQGVQQGPGPDGGDGPGLLGLDTLRFGVEAGQFLGGEVADLAVSGGHGGISLHRTRTSRLLRP